MTYKNSTPYLNLFVRYCRLKNPVFCVVLRILDQISKTRIFPHVVFAESYAIRTLTFKFKKNTKVDKTFNRSSYTSLVLAFLGDFFGEPPEPSWTFCQKTDSVTFLTLWFPNLMQKIRKKEIYYFWDLALLSAEQMDEQVNS